MWFVFFCNFSSLLGSNTTVKYEEKNDLVQVLVRLSLLDINISYVFFKASNVFLLMQTSNNCQNRSRFVHKKTICYKVSLMNMFKYINRIGHVSCLFLSLTTCQCSKCLSQWHQNRPVQIIISHSFIDKCIIIKWGKAITQLIYCKQIIFLGDYFLHFLQIKR